MQGHFICFLDDVDGNVKFPSPHMGNGNVPNNRYYGDLKGPHMMKNSGDYPGQSFDKRSPPVMQLPLDEDDYLQPKSANPQAYLDLENNKG